MNAPPITPGTPTEDLLKVRDLRKRFAVKGGILSRTVDQVHAVDGVSFDIGKGETLGLVGESGCGKSTTGRCILRLIEPSSGEIWFKGADVRRMGGDDLRALRRDMQIIFQDPYASLNPRLKVGAIIGEALTIHKLAPTQKAMEDRVVQLLETVGLQGAGFTARVTASASEIGAPVRTVTPRHSASSRCGSRVASGSSSRRPSTITTSYFSGSRADPIASSASGIVKNTAFGL